MELTKTTIVTAAAVPIVLLLIHGPQSAQAYWGPCDGFGGWNGNDPFSDWNGGRWNGWHGSVAYSNGYYAGQQDATYDHDNNLAYNPVGQCLSCHSELYWHSFHQGYDQQWDSYQAQ